MVRRYIRDGSLFRENAAARVGLKAARRARFEWMLNPFGPLHPFRPCGNGRHYFIPGTPDSLHPQDRRAGLRESGA